MRNLPNTLMREIRVRSGLRLVDLGERVGLSAATLYEYERARRKPSVQTAQKINEALGKDVFKIRDLSQFEPIEI